MRALTWLCILQLLLLVTACVWKPVSYDDAPRQSVGLAIDEFRSEDALNRFFDDAVAYVVFSASVRAGSGLGGAYGSGVTPSFSQEIAMLTQVHGGLLLEASVGAQRYDFSPLGNPADE